MARVTVHPPGFLAKAHADTQRAMAKAVRAAIREALEPPPPGMVRVSINIVVSQALLDDEEAFGAFLVRAAKRGVES